MLKSCFFLLVGIFTSASSIFGQSGFVLKGKIAAEFPQVIQIQYLDKVDSVLSGDGQFRFPGNLQHPAQVWLSSKNPITNRVVSKELFIEAGEIEVESDFNQLSWAEPKMQYSGSQQILDAYNYKFSLLVNIYRFTRDSLVNRSAMDSILKKRIKKLSDKILRFEELYEKDFILQNRDNYVGAYFFYRYGINFMKEGEIDSVYALFTDKVKNSFYLNKVAEKQKYAKLLKEGAPVPQLRLHNTKQKEVLINPLFTKKITLIDIWASWCVPCIKTHDLLKTLFTKYNKAGLNIVGVSLDSKPDSWLKFLQKKPLPWSNFIDPKGEAGEVNNIFNLVSGNGIPFFVLVNEKGEYLKIGIEPEELESYIESYLKR